MKKALLITLSLLLVFILACTNKKEVDETEHKFIGTISKIEENIAIVSIEEGEILKSGDSVKVDLSVNKEDVFFIGDKVEVEYDGMIRESNPLSINTISIKHVK